MDCVLLLFQRHLDPVTVDAEKPCTKPSWSEALKLMAAPNFLQGLLSFPKVYEPAPCVCIVCMRGQLKHRTSPKLSMAVTAD